MNIVVVGTGYLGFVTGACLASKGNNVVCVDREVGKLAKLERGAMPICEPRLDKVVQSGGTCSASTFCQQRRHKCIDPVNFCSGHNP